MKKPKGIYKWLIFVAIVIIVALLLMWPPVSNAIAPVFKTTGDKIRQVARTIVGIGIGVALVSWGIAALSLPLLGGAMVIIGLAVLAYSVWPLFSGGSRGSDVPTK